MKLTYTRNGKEYSVETESLKAESLSYLLQYGFSQSLQDSIAGAEKAVRQEYKEQADAAGETVDEAEVAEAVKQDIDGTLQKRVDAILAGTVGTRVPQQRDPFAAMCKRIATEMARKGFKAANIKWPKDRADEVVGKVLEKHKAAIEAEAKKRLDAQSEVTVDMTGIVA